MVLKTFPYSITMKSARLKDLGERKVIEHLLTLAYRDPSEIMGYDDISLVRLKEDLYLALKVDSMSFSADIPHTMDYHSVGWKLVTMVISDFAAKGVAPLGMLISLIAPADSLLGEIEDIYRGVREACEYYKVYLWGGDLGEGLELVLNCFVVGTTKNHRIPTRSGARVGDLVFTTGYFGLTTLAYLILLEGVKVRDSKTRNLAIKALFRPIARLREGLTLVQRGLVNASIDSSDGLSESLHEIASRSKVKIVIEKPPIHPRARRVLADLNLDPVYETLYRGGEEYEIVFTVPEEKVPLLRKLGLELKSKFLYIGRVEKGSGVVLLREGREERVERKGWEHFK
ncbi:MAG: thiamine-phosphate kinase [Thermoprotei archaeon]|nr:MAG: thiamine-phosphate kinase [Thermoprotei archaeon]